MLPQAVRSARLLLNAPGEADIEAIAEYCRDPLFERFLTTPWPYTRRDAEYFVRDFVPGGWKSDTEFTWAIRSAPGTPLMGVIGWRARGDVGFWMGAPHRGHGYMAEALGAVADWVFATHDVDEIAWECLPGNVASAHVARAAGFRYSGMAPVLVPARDGSLPDSWHGVLRRDGERDVADAAVAGWPL
ncbi:GNAT family N-acetyltransferase [soil metagenome]